MKKNKIKVSVGLLLVLLVLSTGCNKKEGEITSYDKEDSNIIEQEGNQIEDASNITEDRINQANTSENNTTSNSNKNSNVSNSTEVLVKEIKVVVEKIDGANLVVVKAYDKNSKLVWSYTTKTTYRIASSAPEYYEGEKYVYVNDGGNLVALNIQTGKKIWTKTDYIGRDMCDAVEINGKLYIIGDTTYQLTIINMNNGKTIKNLDTINQLDKDDSKTMYSMLGNLRVNSKGLILINAYTQGEYDLEKEVTISFNPNDYSVKIVKNGWDE